MTWTRYLPAVLSLAAALTGIIGDTHDETAGVTALGWGAIVVAILSFVVLTRTLSWQERQKVQIRRVAHQEIAKAVSLLIRPFRTMLYEIWNKDTRSKLIDYGRTDDDWYVLEALSRSDIRAEVSRMSCRVSPKHVYPPIVWWKYLADSATDGSEALNQVAGKYSAYLDAETLIALEDLRSDELVRHLPHLDVIVTINEPLPNLTLEHALWGARDYAALDGLLKHVGTLLTRIGERPRAATA